MESGKFYYPEFESLRRHKRMRLYQVAQITGLSRQVISRIEKGLGNPKMKNVLKYCEAIGVKLVAIIKE